jgi:hypothetical protein
MKKNSKGCSTFKIIAATTLILFLAFLAFFDYKIYHSAKNQTNIFGDTTQNNIEVEKIDEEVIVEEKKEEPKIVTELPKEKPLPTEALITVPYTRQAPFSVWDALHEDACEEASLLMVKHFLDGTKISDKQSIDNEIIDLVNFEEENGYQTSITLDELNAISKNKYGISGVVKKNITNNDIKKEIAAGKPVIVGAAGKILPNPYFRNGGPIYHMLVITGYDNTNFITNDPGTMKGDGFKYTFSDLYNAIHDWDPTNIMNGQKAYLVF